jgi:hypothetical protein
MPPFTGPPMDLRNMRSLGVTRIMAYCACRHEASIDVSALPDDLAVPVIKNRLRCIKWASGRCRPGPIGGNIMAPARLSDEGQA